MQGLFYLIKRRHTGASPETFQLTLIGFAVTAFLLFIQKLFKYANPKSQFRIYGGGAKNPANRLPFQKLCSSL